MQAVMTKDEYIDITPNYPYEVDRVFSEQYIKLKGSPRRYESKCFDIMHKGKKISHDEAYRLHKIEVVKANLGMK